MNKTLSRWLMDYGMALVLVLLCLYYSWATYQKEEARGKSAGTLLAQQIHAEIKTPASVLIVARTSEEDAEFAGALEEGLKTAGYEIAGKVLGDPRAAKQALNKRAETGAALQVIATTSDCGAWTVWDGLTEKLPALGAPRVMVPGSRMFPAFLKTENLLNVANQSAIVAILAIGMTLVILTGGIDLSVGSIIAFSAVVTALLIRNHGGVGAGTGTLVWCSLTGMAAGAGLGLFSGVMITAFRLPPFIVTLAMMKIAEGGAYIMVRSGTISEVPAAFGQLNNGASFGIPHGVWLMAGLYIIAHLLASRTVLGRYIYAVGGNAEAARLSGVRVSGVVVLVYVISGTMAGLGGVLMTSQFVSGAATYGSGYELFVIAAVVVGGTSLSGGEGRIFGTLIGALIIGVINNGMNLTGVESQMQKVVLGAVILVAVLLDTLKKRGSFEWLRIFRRHR